MLSHLTDRQKLIYDFLVRTIRENGYAPSIQEIGARFKIVSTNGVFRHLKALEKKGYIRRAGKRALEILSPLGKPAIARAREVPVLGKIAAGKPLLAVENMEGVVVVDNQMVRGRAFAVKVRRDSMIEAGILDGDYVIVRPQETAENGEIVCALIDGEATLKRFFRKGDSVTLKAENKSYAPLNILEGEFRVLGKAVGLTRRL